MAKKQKESNSKTNLDAEVYYLTSILQKTTSFVQHLDMQINILIGLSSAIFVFSASVLINDNSSLIFMTLSIFSALAAIVGLYAIHPPRYMRKKGQNESLMYNKKIISFESSKQYIDKLKLTVGDSGKILEQYAVEIYNMGKYYYAPKRKLFKISRTLLLLGVLGSALILWLS